jgi:hypothetical protein
VLTYRSGMMGMIIQTDDRQAAEAYGRAVQHSPLLALVEGWAFPTYTKDVKVTAAARLPHDGPSAER